MPRVFPAAALLLSLAFPACTPTYNWREITIAPPGLHASFPCKPDQAERKLPFAQGREAVVHAVGCEAGGASYAVLWADLDSPAGLGAALSQWKQASLAAANARPESEAAFVPRGALAIPESVQVRGTGRRPDGSAVQGAWAHFARGRQVFQAMVYAPSLKSEMAESFFTGLRFE
jgi:hypothetical protein